MIIAYLQLCIRSYNHSHFNFILNCSSGGYDFQRAYRGGDGEDSEASDVRVKSAKNPDSIVSSKESEEENSNRSLLSNSSERSSLKMENVSLFTDDDSFERMYAGKYEEEERVEVIAPAGKQSDF